MFREKVHLLKLRRVVKYLYIQLEIIINTHYHNFNRFIYLFIDYD